MLRLVERHPCTAIEDAEKPERTRLQADQPATGEQITNQASTQLVVHSEASKSARSEIAGAV